MDDLFDSLILLSKKTETLKKFIQHLPISSLCELEKRYPRKRAKQKLESTLFRDSLFVWGCFYGRFELAEAFFYRVKKRVRENGLIHASFCGSVEIVEFLLSRGVNCRTTINIAFTKAVYTGSFEVVKILYDLGASKELSKNIVSRLLQLRGQEPVDIIKYIKLDLSKVDLPPSFQMGGSMKVYLVELGLLKLEKMTNWCREEYFEYFYYRKWRRIHLRKWIRRVLIPLYYSPGFPGGVLNKRAITTLIESLGYKNENSFSKLSLEKE